MKKWKTILAVALATLVFLLIMCLLLSGFRNWLFPPLVTREGAAHYQYTWEVTEEWQKKTNRNVTNLAAYGEYLYNSELLLIPRETPSTLKDYYFCWLPLIDADHWAIYYTCTLTPENYAGFTEGLEHFVLESGARWDREHFAYPAIILQWMDPGEKWEVLEYLLLDEGKNSVIFVYTMGELETIDAYSAYDISPTTLNILAEDEEKTVELWRQYTGFSVYDGAQGAEFNLEFLKYLQ